MGERSNKLAVRNNDDIYMEQIRKIPVLSAEEEKSLAMKWFETRDRDAGQKLVVSNLRFVVKIAREYSRYGFKLSDLVQEGNMGLLHALDRYDPRKGFRLISYAVWWIRAYIQAYVLRSWSIVRMGTTRVQRRIFSSLQKAQRKIAALSMGEPVGRKELAAELEVSESDLNDAVSRMQRRDVSLEQPVSKESEVRVGDSIADETANAEDKLISFNLQEKVREKLDEVYEKLSPRERFILDNRLLAEEPMTLEAAGHQFGVTRERVRQIEERLKGRLRVEMTPTVS